MNDDLKTGGLYHKSGTVMIADGHKSTGGEKGGYTGQTAVRPYCARNHMLL
jgi:hypothetical protein